MGHILTIIYQRNVLRGETRRNARNPDAGATGVRVNIALAQALGVEVLERLRPEEGARGPDDEASSCASDESDNESFTV